MSSGLFQIMPHLKHKLQPTSFTFSGVGEGTDKYDGILPGLHLSFTDKLSAAVNVAVVPNPKKFLLVGNDLVGGAYAELARVGQNDPLGYMVL
jgi:hypothetical protein